MRRFDVEWKGKHIETGEWLIGSLYDDGGEQYLLPPYPGSAIDYEEYQVNPNTLGIWIGEHDKNNKRIYTGDILKNKGKLYCPFIYPTIFQIALQSDDKKVRGLVGFKFEESEIIGNIYDF